MIAPVYRLRRLRRPAALPSGELTLASVRGVDLGGFWPGTGGTNVGTVGSSGSFAAVPRGDNPSRSTAGQYVARAFPAGEFSNSSHVQPFVWNVPERVTRSLSTGLGYQMTRTIDFDAAISYTLIKSETRLAPSPISTTGDHNLLVPASNFYNPFGIPFALTYRPLEVGARIAKIASESRGYRAGVRGTLRDRFDWDLGWAYPKNPSTDRTTNSLSESAVRAALAKNTPDALTVFGGPTFKNHPATLDSIKVISGKDGSAATMIFEGRLTTIELESLSWGTAGGSFSAQHRAEHFDPANDALSTTLDAIIGQVRLADPIKAARTVDSASAELRVPLRKSGAFVWCTRSSGTARRGLKNLVMATTAGSNPLADRAIVRSAISSCAGATDRPFARRRSRSSRAA